MSLYSVVDHDIFYWGISSVYHLWWVSLQYCKLVLFWPTSAHEKYMYIWLNWHMAHDQSSWVNQVFFIYWWHITHFELDDDWGSEVSLFHQNQSFQNYNVHYWKLCRKSYFSKSPMIFSHIRHKVTRKPKLQNVPFTFFCQQIRLIIRSLILLLTPLKTHQTMTMTMVNSWWTHLFLSSLHSINTL